jgi:hypothetical protein
LEAVTALVKILERRSAAWLSRLLTRSPPTHSPEAPCLTSTYKDLRGISRSTLVKVEKLLDSGGPDVSAKGQKEAIVHVLFVASSERVNADIYQEILKQHNQCCQVPKRFHCHFSPKPRPFWHTPLAHSILLTFKLFFRLTCIHLCYRIE